MDRATKKIAEEVIGEIQNKLDPHKRYIFRGVNKKYKQISSTLYRLLQDKIDKNIVIDDMRLIESHFVNGARPHIRGASNEIEILTTLQHYGGLTNLIDFTHNYLIALFFACTDSSIQSKNSEEDTGQVFLLSYESDKVRKYINYLDDHSFVSFSSTIKNTLLQNNDNSKIFEANPTVAIDDKFYSEDGYVIINPVSKEPRPIFQNSVFAYHRNGFFNEKDFSKNNKIELTRNKKEAILQYLHNFCGISKNSIYNDIFGFIQNQKNDSAIYNFSGFHSLIQNDYEKAIRELGEAIKSDPFSVSAYVNRGNVYSMMSEIPKAIEDYTMAINLSPQSEILYINRASANANMGNYDNSIEDFTKAIELNPYLSDAYSKRGQVYSEVGKFDEAFNDYSHIIELDPNSEDAYCMRGAFFRQNKKFKEALEDYKRAEELNPQYEVIYISRGNVYSLKLYLHFSYSLNFHTWHVLVPIFQ